MKRSPKPDWQEVEHLVRTTDLSFYAISKRTGAAETTIRSRADRGQWRAMPDRRPSGARPGAGSAVAAKRALVRRFYKAIDTKLRQMERRMQSDIAKGGAVSSAADHERDTRAIGGLINQLGKISEYESDLDRPTAQGEEFAAVAAEAERYRRELAERLARLVPPVE